MIAGQKWWRLASVYLGLCLVAVILVASLAGFVGFVARLIGAMP